MSATTVSPPWFRTRCGPNAADRPPSDGRLPELVGLAGCAPLASANATQTWSAWNPDESAAPDGCFSMESLADDLVDADRLAPTDRPRFLSTIHDAARRDQFSMSLTMYAVVAVAP